MAAAPVRTSRVTDVCKAWENGISLHFLHFLKNIVNQIFA